MQKRVTFFLQFFILVFACPSHGLHEPGSELSSSDIISYICTSGFVRQNKIASCAADVLMSYIGQWQATTYAYIGNGGTSVNSSVSPISDAQTSLYVILLTLGLLPHTTEYAVHAIIQQSPLLIHNDPIFLIHFTCRTLPILIASLSKIGLNSKHALNNYARVIKTCMQLMPAMQKSLNAAQEMMKLLEKYPPDIDELMQLLQDAPSVNFLEYNDRIPLSLLGVAASNPGATPILAQLVAIPGANVNIRNLGSFTPLHMATYPPCFWGHRYFEGNGYRAGHEELINNLKLLLSLASIDINAVCQYGHTALDYAIFSKDPNKIKLIQDYQHTHTTKST